MNIRKVAVIGSGVMGSGIAALLSNADISVILLDIVPAHATDRSMLAKQALERMEKATPSPFTHSRNKDRIFCGNIEDHFNEIKKADWIIEVVIEKLAVKQDLYLKIDAIRKHPSIISSNTSTLPLHQLTKDMPESFLQDFVITHFFNPPRFMKLLEVITGPSTDDSIKEIIENFARIQLGKGVVHCKDTPGFIANRIGCYWLYVGLAEALKQKISVADADCVMSKPVGIPPTGIFGLIDLIGVDLLTFMADSLRDHLSPKDIFVSLSQHIPLLDFMITNGLLGRKKKSGFYRVKIHENTREKEILDLITHQYIPYHASSNDVLKMKKDQNLKDYFMQDDPVIHYGWSVLWKVLYYSVSLVPEIAEDIRAIDQTMKLGYNWKKGPFELIDALSDATMSGAMYLKETCQKNNYPIPPLLENVITSGTGKFYQEKDNKRSFFTTRNTYVHVSIPPEEWTLADHTQDKKPIAQNASASLWDIGDNVACLTFHSKMNILDHNSFDMIMTSIEKVGSYFTSLVIGHDSDYFSLGADLHFFVKEVKAKNWSKMEELIKQGQEAYMALKYAPFPVIGACSGYALGGGCELLMHCDGVQAHMESNIGLVEMGVGILPSWGGVKELIIRAHEQGSNGSKNGSASAFLNAFHTVQHATISRSAEEAKDLLFLNKNTRITMNRSYLLSDAKSYAQEWALYYTPPSRSSFKVPVEVRPLLLNILQRETQAGQLTEHDKYLVGCLIEIFAKEDSHFITEEKLLEAEVMSFMHLIKKEETLARMEHMLATGKRLKN